ncbi:MAG: 50S ribosomal protein L34 [Candidatus Moeniiplasma glomeromycotorum]|nr:50S ribosomal protein L34 [Candidatus Moeniiplasma glomeromycotorum]MCE8168553.1 50S ribosomal protein L34 [Candidatus Moeniiplasma glomeromycotorum]
MLRPYQPSKIVRAREHGWRKRKRKNPKVLWQRRQKGRHNLIVFRKKYF